MVRKKQANIAQSGSVVRVEPLRVIVETAELTTCLVGDRPLSLMLISESGAGKTRIVLTSQFAGSRNVQVLSDFTGFGFLELIEQSMRDGKYSGMFLVPDFNAALSHKQATTGYTLATLLTLLGEGVVGEIAMPEVKKKLDLVMKSEVKIGIIACVTPQMIYRRSAQWKALGLIRRLLPVFYTYGPGTVSIIQSELINSEGTGKFYEMHKTALPLCKFAVSIPQEMRSRVMNLASNTTNTLFIPFWKKDGTKGQRKAEEYPFDVQNAFATYTRAHAIRTFLESEEGWQVKKKKWNREGKVVPLTANEENWRGTEELARFVRFENPVVL